jgi:peptidylprolyl isomerase
MRRLAIIVVLLALALAGCGGGSEKPATSAKATATPDAATAVSELADSISKDIRKKPQVPIPEGATPTSLVIKDLREGTGPAAQAGQTATVQYVGVNFKNGKQFDASWDRGQPFSFALGGGQVIPGWDQGVQGMKVGGRRMLTIPPDKAYGAQGSPPKIGPNETLAFVVDLVSVK